MVKLIQNSFLGGMMDYEMMGRQDFDKYRHGASLLQNFSFLRRGAISKRPGTNFVADITDRISGDRYRILPFSYLADRGWVVVFVDHAAFCATSDGTIVDVQTPEAHEGEDTRIPYTQDELSDISYVQCGDVMFIAHHNHPPAKIEHVDKDTFKYSVIDVTEYMRGIPKITNASVSRVALQPQYEGGTMIERYKATAVRNGVESLPSPPKSVSYYLPWTESQSINVSVSWEGEPERINIYKQGSGTYGLIGVLEATSYTATSKYDTFTGLSPIHVEDNQTPTEILDNVNKHSIWQSAWYSPNGTVTVEMITQGQECSMISVSMGYTFTKKDSSGNIKATFVPTMAGNSGRIKLETRSGTKWSSYPTKTISQKQQTVERDFTVAEYGTKEAAEEAAQNWSDSLESENILIKEFTMKRVDAIRLTADVKEGSSYHAAAGTVVVATDGTVSITGSPLVIGNISATGESSMPTSFKDDNIVPDASVTPPERKEVFSKTGDYPSTVAIYQQRLVWAGSDNDPARIWMSRIGDLYMYAPHDVMVADDPIDFVLPITRFAKINFIIELRKLIVFSDACEWVVGSNSATQGVSYETIMATPHSFLGCDKRLPPIVCNNSLIFCERTGQDVRRYGYQLEDDGYGGINISILASSIFSQRRIKDWAYQQHPDSTVWSVMSDGDMVSLAWMEEQDIIAWGTHKIGGPDARVTGIANTYALVGTSENPTTDEVFIIVERGTGENKRIVLESMRVWPKDIDTIQNAVCMDSVRTISSADTPREGTVLIDPVTGDILKSPGENGAIEGYPFEAKMVSVYPLLGNDIGNAQFDIKMAQHAHLRTMHSCGGSVRAYGAPVSSASKLHGRPKFIGDGRVYLGNRDETVVLSGVNDGDGRIVVEQDDPWPFALLMMETDFDVEENYRR